MVSESDFCERVELFQGRSELILFFFFFFSDSAKACAVMSTNMLAFLLLNKYREGVNIEELVIAFDKLRQQLTSDNKDVGFTGDSIDVINNAIRLLGPSLVKREKRLKSSESTEYVEVVTPLTVLPNVIELSYYSNALLPHFMVEGVVGMYFSKKQEKKIIYIYVISNCMLVKSIFKLIKMQFCSSKRRI